MIMRVARMLRKNISMSSTSNISTLASTSEVFISEDYSWGWAKMYKLSGSSHRLETYLPIYIRRTGSTSQYWSFKEHKLI